MTKHEANAALCRELGVEPIDYRGKAVECRVCHRTKKPRGRSAPLNSSYCETECEGYYQEPIAGDLWWNETGLEFGYTFSKELAEPIYPDLADANLLMAALRAKRISFTLFWDEVRVSPPPPRNTPHSWANLRDNETHGHMLFRAACAAFGIEVD